MTSIRIKFPLKTLLLTALIINCAAVIYIWFFDISNGAYPLGLFANQEEASIPAFHLVSEILMAVLTLSGIVGLLKGYKWGRGVALFGLGMFFYSSVNSLGWAIATSPVLAFPMVLTLILVIIVFPMLMKE